ncbi:hypothetical protein CL616_02445 [archaeon]|nr:hypothetical protein [archaeon]
MVNYLLQGEQTQLTPRVMKHAEAAMRIRIDETPFRDYPSEALVAGKICKYISHLPLIEGYTRGARKDSEERINSEIKDRVFRKRTLDQMLEQGLIDTCSDKGLVFRGLMIAQGIPVAYVETFHVSFLEEKDSKRYSFHGHVLGRVILSDNSVLVDPGKKSDCGVPEYYSDEIDLFGKKGYVVFREGFDSWDVGIRGYRDMHRLRDANLRMLSKKVDRLKVALFTES